MFWADGDISLGDHHTAFKLSKDGEAIGIFNTDLNAVDTLSFGAQTADISFGRFPDGTAVWEFFNLPTPGASNIASTIGIDNLAEENALLIYPNPLSEGRIYFGKAIDCKIYNISGVLVYEALNVSSIESHYFKPGIYFVYAKKGSKGKFIVY